MFNDTLKTHLLPAIQRVSAAEIDRTSDPITTAVRHLRVGDAFVSKSKKGGTKLDKITNIRPCGRKNRSYIHIDTQGGNGGCYYVDAVYTVERAS